MPETKTVIIKVDPTVTAGAYSAGDALGGLLTFENALAYPKRTGVILSAVLLDEASQDDETELVLFDRTFTATTDNAAFDPTDADLLNCLGVISFGAGNYYNFTDNSIATVRNVGLGIRNLTEDKETTDDSAIYGQLVTRGTPTYVAITDIQVILTILQD